MDRLRAALRSRRHELIDRWRRQLLAMAEAGFALDPATGKILPALLDRTGRALVRRFAPLPPGNGPRNAGRRAAMQASLLGDFVFDALRDAIPGLSAAEQRALSGALAHGAVQVLVERAAEAQRHERARLASVVHELRDAMTGAQLASDLLRARGAGSEALGRALRRLRAAIEDAALDELLATATLRRTRLRLGPVLRECASTAGELGAAAKRVQVHVAQTPLAVVGDARVLRPAVRGVLRAAIELAQPNSTVRFDARSALARNRLVVRVERCRIEKPSSAPTFAVLRRAARAQGGAFALRVMQPSGCLLTLTLPAAR